MLVTAQVAEPEGVEKTATEAHEPHAPAVTLTGLNRDVSSVLWGLCVNMCEHDFLEISWQSESEFFDFVVNR